MLLRWVTVLNVINKRKIHASVYRSINGVLKYLEIKLEMEYRYFYTNFVNITHAER